MSDNFPTNSSLNSIQKPQNLVRRQSRKSARGPYQIIRFQSVKIPIYAFEHHGKTRYTIAFYLNGCRKKRQFTFLEDAKQEGLLIAQNIVRGMQSQNDLHPAERESFHAAQRILQDVEIPLVAAVEDYVQCRKILGGASLRSAVEEYCKRMGGLKQGVTVSEIAEELIIRKSQDGVSARYLEQLRSILGLFLEAFPGPIIDIQSEHIDSWLRKSKIGAVTRNNRLTILRVLFGFAKQRNYLPASEPTAADSVSKVKAGNTTTEIFEPEEIERLLLAAPAILVPYLAIAAFAGLRRAELCRLDWKAVKLERRIIELRADQAKTASRRIIPISDNLLAWLAPLERKGKVCKIQELPRMAPVLAETLGIRWPHNALRHSYISYRLALIQDVNKVALEAGNSSTMIFRHYRELVSEEAAEKWFSIYPPEGWEPPEKVGGLSLLTVRRKKD